MELHRHDDQRSSDEIAAEDCGSLPNEIGRDAVPDTEIVHYPSRIAVDQRTSGRVHPGQSRGARAKPRNCPAHVRALKVVVVDNEDDLCIHVPAWQDLADHAIEANVFYEPWLLRPALRTLNQGTPLRLVFIYEPAWPQGSGASRLCGFFPLEPISGFRNAPIGAWRLWKHLHCFLCTPLIRPDRARDTLAALLHWAGHDGEAHIVDFSHIRGDGPVHDLLVAYANETGAQLCVTSRFARAFWKQGQELEAHLRRALSKGVRKEYRRQRKRLGELGRLEFRTLRQAGELDSWLDDFLRLEASGWKALEGTALGINANERAYVREAAKEGFARNQLLLQGLFLDGRPVSMLLSFLSGSGGYTFKIAYDEAFAKFSPGVQVMLDVLACLHSDTRLAWMDSCAEPDHPMINRLWKDERIIASVLVSTGNWLGDLAVSLCPAGRRLVHLFRGLQS